MEFESCGEPGRGRIYNYGRSQKWPTLHGEDKLQLVENIVNIETTLASTSFRDFGSLYYTKDLKQPARKDVLYTDTTGMPIVNAQFSIGPTTDRKSLENDRANVDFDRGPCEDSIFLSVKSNID